VTAADRQELIPVESHLRNLRSRDRFRELLRTLAYRIGGKPPDPHITLTPSPSHSPRGFPSLDRHVMTDSCHFYVALMLQQER